MKKTTKELLIEMMQADEELGLYQEEPKQDNCCTPEGQIKRYLDCKGCDRKPKQETIEESMDQNGYHDLKSDELWREGFQFGTKWQQERMYSDDYVFNLLIDFAKWYNSNEIIKPRSLVLRDDIQLFIIEQFKNNK